MYVENNNHVKLTEKVCSYVFSAVSSDDYMCQFSSSYKSPLAVTARSFVSNPGVVDVTSTVDTEATYQLQSV